MARIRRTRADHDRRRRREVPETLAGGRVIAVGPDRPRLAHRMPATGAEPPRRDADVDIGALAERERDVCRVDELGAVEEVLPHSLTAAVAQLDEVGPFF